MIIFIILIALTITGIVIAVKSYDYEGLGVIIAFIFGIYLILHILFWSISSYDYNKFVVKRQAFVETLEYARQHQNQFELAAITKDVSEWNEQLAESKYDNSLFLVTDYVDDRIETLEPIQ